MESEREIIDWVRPEPNDCERCGGTGCLNCIELSPKEAEAFLDAIRNPSRPSEEAKAAARKSGEIFGG